MEEAWRRRSTCQEGVGRCYITRVGPERSWRVEVAPLNKACGAQGWTLGRPSLKHDIRECKI